MATTLKVGPDEKVRIRVKVNGVWYERDVEPENCSSTSLGRTLG